MTKPLRTLLKIAPAGKVFALAVPVQKGSHLAFSVLPGDENRSQTRGPLDAKRATFPPKARVTVILIDAPRAQEERP